jgi:hypothetical protein
MGVTMPPFPLLKIILQRIVLGSNSAHRLHRLGMKKGAPQIGVHHHPRDVDEGDKLGNTPTHTEKFRLLKKRLHRKSFKLSLPDLLPCVTDHLGDNAFYSFSSQGLLCGGHPIFPKDLVHGRNLS